ncbi:preprotein translocase subunit SecE [Slackia exigua]|uniref:preprotein translocase subunit SecE n=1 Tax=Slackia exigua TaxID=84109 RepID=UPI00210E45E9|nr:preprotein translocase subunit SecE [Slackia exigua]MCQ5092351.1 preprotein translocase subunit SecE [Slackia exigua]
MRFNYLNWVIATALILTVFSVAIIAIGYQPLSPLRALTVVALLVVAGAAWVVKRRKSGER